MKIIQRTLAILGLLFIAGWIVACVIVFRVRNRPLPVYSGELSIAGLTEEVSILRDSFAIPHIYAKNEADLYFSVGYTMAQDRLWQMDLMRRVTEGRLSEILGESQVSTDLLMRSLRIRKKSEWLLRQSSPEIRNALSAFSAGVNSYMVNHPLPFEFQVLGYQPEAWEPVHSANLIGYLSWDLTSGWRTEMLLYQVARKVSSEYLAALMPDMSNHPTFIFPDFHLDEVQMDETLLSAADQLHQLGVEVFQGSNNWAVSGEKSKSGKPLLANDMHLGLFSPGIWYQMHHVVEGSLNVSGVVLPGQPFIISGHNDSIAWGMTNVAVDDIDFYAETLNRDSTAYLLDGVWKDLLVQEEWIHIKGEKPVRKVLRFTHRGPLINRFKEENETAISMRWIGNEMSNEMRSVYLLNRAANFDDFRSAVKTFHSVSQNIVYADVNGNIGLQTCAGVPVRKGRGVGVYRGDTSLWDWQGFVPFENLPFEFNPERGYVSSANNKTVPDDYPYYIGSWFAMPDRIDRIREMLDDTEYHNVESFARMQNDFKSKKAERFVPAFLEVLNQESAKNETEQHALKKLQDWDYTLCRESQAASIFEVLFRKTAESLIRDELPGKLFHLVMRERIIIENLMNHVLLHKSSPWIDDLNTPEHESWNNMKSRAFQETVDELIKQLGPDVDHWSWEKLHTITFNHPLGVKKILNRIFGLNRGPFGVPGSYHTATPYAYSYTNLYHVNHGASHRHIFDLANWNNSKTVIPTGTSGIPASDFYMDQTPLYIENNYHQDPFTRDEVMKRTRFTMKLLPENY